MAWFCVEWLVRRFIGLYDFCLDCVDKVVGGGSGICVSSFDGEFRGDRLAR